MLIIRRDDAFPFAHGLVLDKKLVAQTWKKSQLGGREHAHAVLLGVIQLRDNAPLMIVFLQLRPAQLRPVQVLPRDIDIHEGEVEDERDALHKPGQCDAQQCRASSSAGLLHWWHSFAAYHNASWDQVTT